MLRAAPGSEVARRGVLIAHVAVESDLGAVSEILGDATAWLESVRVSQWHPEDFAQPVLRAWLGQLRLVTRNGEPCGVYRLMEEDPAIWPTVEGECQQVLHTLALHRSHRGQGLGSHLLDLASDDAAALGADVLRLDCWAGNQPLIRLYSRAGFRQAGLLDLGSYTSLRWERETRLTP